LDHKSGQNNREIEILGKTSMKSLMANNAGGGTPQTKNSRAFCRRMTNKSENI
jgi:hypothetical protein